MSAVEEWASRYISKYRLSLVQIPPGHKAPLHEGWNKPGGYVTDIGEAQQRWGELPDHGIGVVLAPSGLCSLDIDAPDHALPVLGELGLDLESLRKATPTIQGNPPRYRLMFKAPPGVALGRKPLVWPARQPGEKPLTLFELRAGDIQDVLPPTLHPETGGPYVWLTPPNAEFPRLPEALLELWQQWDSYRKELEGLCPWTTQGFRPEAAPRGPGARPNVIAEFNRARSVDGLLAEYGYRCRGKRWISPTSSSGLAGVVVLDGRVFSHHASDPLADGHGHDAFDLFRILDHGGDARSAVKAAAEELGVSGSSSSGTYRAGNGAAPGMDSSGTRVLPSPSNPLAVARKLIEEKHQTDAVITLINHRGDFFRWDGACWPERDRLDIRRDAYAFAEGANYLDAEGKSQPFAPTVRKINDLIDALRACVGITSEHEPPVWLDGRANPPASEIIAMQNGLLHLPTRAVLPHTPSFFAHHALAFPFVADAPEPVLWLEFLRQLWPDDQASIDALQELFGYVIGGGTRQQKIFLLVGPRRAGKGTIGRVLTGILGRHNVAAPTLASLCTNFGLAPLIGKPLALISDARLSAKADAKAAVERLLSISGEDSLTIDRKYREPWTGRLPSRIVVLTNELPGLTDASGALSSRFIVLVLSTSFLGRENPGLTDTLLAEAPSILKWGLEGLGRLNRRGHFVMPESGHDAVQQLEDLASPVAAFVRERCTVHHDAFVEVDELWRAWKEWCEGQGRGHGTKAVFGRDLRAALPAVKKSRPRDGEERQYRYEGVALAVGTTLAGRGDRPDHSGRGAAFGHAGPSGPSDHAMYHLHGGTPGRTCPRCDGEGCDWCGGTGRIVAEEPAA